MMRRCEPERWVLTPRERHGEGLDSRPPFADGASECATASAYIVADGTLREWPTMMIEERGGVG
jgi:hypothetical protein